MQRKKSSFNLFLRIIFSVQLFDEPERKLEQVRIGAHQHDHILFFNLFLDVDIYNRLWTFVAVRINFLVVEPELPVPKNFPRHACVEHPPIIAV